MAKATVHVHIRPYGAVIENARRIIRARLTELYVWAQYAHDPARAREQHQLRIAAKRLRYTLELFQEFLPEQAGERIKDLRGLQDALGLLHDSDVLIAILRSALFLPDSETPLAEAVPDARELPTALLEVMGQRAPNADLSSAALNYHKETPGDGRHGKRHKGEKKRRKDGKKTGADKRKGGQRLAGAARLRPTGEQRAALEQLLSAKMLERDQLYQQFVRRWEKLETRQFRAAILQLIEEAEAMGHLRPRSLDTPEVGKTPLQR